MSDLNGRFICDTSKEYPMFFKIKINRSPYFQPENRSLFRRKPEEVEEDYQASQRSILRTRVVISDLILCNEFDYFVTFTFSAKKHNRHNVENCRRVMSRFLQNAKYNHSPDLAYIVVPEFHKDGKALHFHALVKNYQGHIKPTKIVKNGRKIYNFAGWRAGFSTAVKIDNHEAVSKYVKKYITKDMPVIFGKKRYFASRNLIRPIKRVNSLIKVMEALDNRQLDDPVYSDEYHELFIQEKVCKLPTELFED